MVYYLIQLLVTGIFLVSIVTKLTRMNKMPMKLGIGVALAIPHDILGFALFSAFFPMMYQWLLELLGLL